MDAQVIDGEVLHEQALEQAETEARQLPAVRASEALVARDEITVDDVAEQRDKITAVMARVMRDGVHYGRIPGVDKPTLLKPGAEVLAVTFRLAPFYTSERVFHDDGHLTVVSKVTLKHIPTGLPIAEGEGLCTTREAKYAWRKGERVCPACGAAAIIKGKQEYGGGWLCWAKRGGCGAKYQDGDPEIEDQNVERVPNPDIADTYNTVLKMGNKRALVAAILNGTAASDVFTQDVEDMSGGVAPEAAGSAGMASRPRGDSTGLAPADVPLGFGKHRGETLGAILETDRGYIEWLADNAKDAPIREAARAVLTQPPAADEDIPF